MSIKHLQIFVNVYKESSITAAAKKLGITQPAASQAIRELETHYSVKLFERAGRGICKTEAANRLYEYAVHISALYSEMEHDFGQNCQPEQLRIGSSISVGTCLMPYYISNFVRQFHVPIPYLKIDSSDIIEQFVLHNQVDFAVIEGNIHSDKILCEPLMEDSLIAVCSRLHPLAAKESVTTADIKEEHFLLREKNSGTRELIDSAFLLHDILINPLWESTSTTAIINAVTVNIGISILPERLVAPYLKQKKIVKVNLKDIEFTRTYNIVYHQNKYLTSDIMNFLNFMKENNPDPKA